jgi:SH3 domain-containing YSC84-like protein 1
MKTHRTCLAGIATLLVSVVGCSSTETTTATETTAATPKLKDRERAINELNDATTTLAALNTADLVPSERLEQTQCAVVIPSLVSGGFIVGASRGTGVATCRADTGWSGPIFISLTGGSAGLQDGLQSSDVLMLVTSRHGMTKLFTSNFKLGADASAAAGPVGKGRAAGTVDMNAEMLTYARSKGVFAGVQLNGALIKHDDAALTALYGTGADPQAILEGRMPAPVEAHAFLDEMKAVFPVIAVVASEE